MCVCGCVCVCRKCQCLLRIFTSFPWGEGKRKRWGVGGERHRAGSGEATSQASCDSALLPDADLNVLSQPPIMLVILLNVSLNTLPVLAFRVIYQALKKPQRKVRGGGPRHTWRTPTARACAGSQDLKERHRWGRSRARHTPSVPTRDQVTGRRAPKWMLWLLGWMQWEHSQTSTWK